MLLNFLRIITLVCLLVGWLVGLGLHIATASNTQYIWFGWLYILYSDFLNQCFKYVICNKDFKKYII